MFSVLCGFIIHRVAILLNQVLKSGPVTLWQSGDTWKGLFFLTFFSVLHRFKDTVCILSLKWRLDSCSRHQISVTALHI